MPIAVLITCAVMLGVWLYFLNMRRKKRKIDAAFSGRASLTASAFYEKYFKEKGVAQHVVVGVRETLEEELDADLSRLKDTDDFTTNIRFFWDFDSMADVAIITALEKKFSIEISDEEAQNAHTIAEIVSMVESAMARKTPEAR